MAGAILEEGDPAAARPYCLRAIELAPNNATIRAGTARVLLDAGYPAEGEEHIHYAIRLNPFHPVFHHGILANALERQGKETEAIRLLTPVLEHNPDYFAGQLRLASLLALSGEVDRARYHAEEARRINPHLTRAGLEHFYRSPDPADFARFYSGLQQAGLVL